MRTLFAIVALIISGCCNLASLGPRDIVVESPGKHPLVPFENHGVDVSQEKTIRFH